MTADLGHGRGRRRARPLVSTLDAGSGRLRPGVQGPTAAAARFRAPAAHRQVPLNDAVRAVLAAPERGHRRPGGGDRVRREPPARRSRPPGLPADAPHGGGRGRGHRRRRRPRRRPTVPGRQRARASATASATTSSTSSTCRPTPSRRATPGASPTSWPTFNHALVTAGRPYLLIGFGRWGSSDPWLGVPVTWPQMSGARVVVEATLPGMKPDSARGRTSSTTSWACACSTWPPHRGRRRDRLGLARRPARRARHRTGPPCARAAPAAGAGRRPQRTRGGDLRWSMTRASRCSTICASEPRNSTASTRSRACWRSRTGRPPGCCTA